MFLKFLITAELNEKQKNKTKQYINELVQCSTN